MNFQYGGGSGQGGSGSQGTASAGGANDPTGDHYAGSGGNHHRQDLHGKQMQGVGEFGSVSRGGGGGVTGQGMGEHSQQMLQGSSGPGISSSGAMHGMSGQGGAGGTSSGMLDQVQMYGSPLQHPGASGKSSHKNKIEQKNRNLNQTHINNNRVNKNVTDAQKRIAKIIKEQDRNQVGASSATTGGASSSHQMGGGVDRHGDAKLRPQLNSSQKSRNAAIQQSKSENLAGHPPSALTEQHQNGAHDGKFLASSYQKGDQSPKQLLLNQQKKLSQQNSNAQYQTSQNNLQGMYPSNSAQPSSTDMQSRQHSTQASDGTGSGSGQQGVNVIRTSSGVRNKPQSSHNQMMGGGQSNYQSSMSQQQTTPGSSSHGSSKLMMERQNPRIVQGSGSQGGVGSGAQRDKNTSHSQPPASHNRIEKPQTGQNGSGGTSGMQQSKSQNQLTTYRGFIMTVQQQQEYMKMEQEQIERFVQSYHPAKFACKKNGVVSSYSANTHQGIVRNYNEDRVSIILNIIKPKFKQVEDWPRCSFFAVYDGHGGSACADFLRDQLHQLIVRDENFPKYPKIAIENGIAEAEKLFLEWAHQQSRPQEDFVERSGTCAIIVLIVGDICYVANVGDSRAIMSVDGGDKILMLSKDHKPEDEEETRRVEENGGQIYQNKSYVPDPSPDNASGVQMIIGPHRVFPGRLSVSRTLGDIEAKDPRYGGNPNCVVATPDIKCFKIKSNYDFIILGCDGVFEKLDNKQVINSIWEASKCDYESDEVIRKNIDPNLIKSNNQITIHQKAGLGVDKCLHECVMAKTLDNITAVMIAFENFESIAQHDLHSKNEALYNEYKNLIAKRAAEPVNEEYIAEESDEVLTLPDVVKDNGKLTYSQNNNDTNTGGPHQESPHLMNKRSRVNSSNKHQQQSQQSANLLASQADKLHLAGGGSNQGGGHHTFSNTQPLHIGSLKHGLSSNQTNGLNSYQGGGMGGANSGLNMSGPQQIPNISSMGGQSSQGGQFGVQTGHIQLENTGVRQKRQNQSKSTLNLQNKQRDNLNLRGNDDQNMMNQNMLRGSGSGPQRPLNSPSLNNQQQNFVKSYQSMQNAQKVNSSQSHQVIQLKNSQNQRAESMKANKVPSNRDNGIGGNDVGRKLGNPMDPNNQMANAGQQSMIYALANKPQNSKDRTITYGTNSGNIQGSGTPVRGTSASQRRKLIAQQTQKYFKQQLGVSQTFRDGTPRQANNQIPQIGTNSQSNRIKSSRQSERHQMAAQAANSGHINNPNGGNQGRAITPKQAKQMYSSINVNKNRNSSQSKLTSGGANSGNEAYLTHQGQSKQQTPNSSSKFGQSVQNLQTATRTSTNISNISNNGGNSSNNNKDYQTNKSSAIGINMSTSLIAVGNMNMATNNFNIHKQGSKIPQKMNNANFNSTQALSKNLAQTQPTGSGAAHYQGLINPMGFSYNSNQGPSHQGNIKLKFESKGGPQQAMPPKNQTINLTGKLTALAEQAEQRRPLGGSQSFMEGVRYKKTSGQLQMFNQHGMVNSHGNFSGTHKANQLGLSSKGAGQLGSQGHPSMIPHTFNELSRPSQSNSNKLGKSGGHQMRDGSRNASNNQKSTGKSQNNKASSHSQRNQGNMN